MSSTLHIAKTPEPEKENYTFKHPLKGILARRYYDHDGSFGGGLVTITPSELLWFEGVLAALEDREAAAFEEVVQLLRDGKSINMWFDV